MVFADKMNEIISELENNGVILFPSDTTWMMGASIKSSKALQIIDNLKNDISKYPHTIMFSDLDMMKEYVPNLHPRIETLLTFHQKPLSIIESNWAKIPAHITSDHKTICFHLVRDIFVQTVITLLDHPMVVSSIRKENLEFVNKFEDIPVVYLKQANYVCKHKRQYGVIGDPSVVASYDKDGNLNFYRE